MSDMEVHRSVWRSRKQLDQDWEITFTIWPKPHFYPGASPHTSLCASPFACTFPFAKPKGFAFQIDMASKRARVATRAPHPSIALACHLHLLPAVAACGVAFGPPALADSVDGALACIALLSPDAVLFEALLHSLVRKLGREMHQNGVRTQKEMNCTTAQKKKKYKKAP
jgi:hypothetical protein